MINKKIAKEKIIELGLDKNTSDVILSVLNLKEKDFEKEFNLKIQTAEKELERAKEKYQDKKEKAQLDATVKIINQTIKDLKIKVKKDEEVENSNSENVESHNRDFNQNSYNNYNRY